LQKSNEKERVNNSERGEGREREMNGKVKGKEKRNGENERMIMRENEH